MVGKGDTITQRQLSVLIFVSLLSPLIRAVPYGSVLFAGRAAWLSPLPAWLAGLVVLKSTGAFVKNAPEGLGLADMALKGLGAVGGRIFCVVMALWLTFFGGSILRASAERLLSSVFPSGGPVILILVTALAAGLAAVGKTRGLARTAELFMPILLTIVVLVCIGAAGDIKPERLLPVTPKDTGRILLGGLTVFDEMGLHVYFLFLWGLVKRPKPGEKTHRWPFLLALALISAVVITLTVGTVGDKLALKLQNAFLVVIRNAQYFGVIERVEAVVVAIWIITDFTMVAAILVIVSEIWRTVFGTKKRSCFVAPAGGLAVAASFLIASDAFELMKWTDLIIPAVNIAFTTLLIPIVLAVGKLRKKY